MSAHLVTTRYGVGATQSVARLIWTLVARSTDESWERGWMQP